MPATDLKNRLIEAATRAGAQKTGFAKAGPVDDDMTERFGQWLEAGNHGEMHYMANHADLRRDPRLLSENTAGANTVMVCAFSYFHHETQAPGAARFAMYAHGDDYHEVLRKRLTPVAELLHQDGFTCRICIDSAPVHERYWAAKSGIGFIGRNSQLIVPGMGSYFFLAEIITSAEIAPDAPCLMSCGNCGKCVKACPAGALRADGGFDARRCLSYLTIEYRGALPTHTDTALRDLRPTAEVLGNRVYGCDECQRVCPHNAHPPETGIREFGLRPELRGITCADILAMTPRQFAETFRHSAVKRAKLTGLQRNAAAILQPDAVNPPDPRNGRG